MDDMDEKFTKRIGIDVPYPEISVIYDAPEEFRNYLCLLMFKYNLGGLRKLRECVCLAVGCAPDPNNWSENDFMKAEIQDIVQNCYWSKVYDVLEAYYEKMNFRERPQFQSAINDYFLENGIGWKFEQGKVLRRSDSFSQIAFDAVCEELDAKGQLTPHGELKQAILDLSRRPTPDITGAVQHSVAALECLYREATGDTRATLGRLTNDFPWILPAPLDIAVSKIFGFASEHGRHLQSGREPNYDEAELLVYLSASICLYLSKKHLKSSQIV